MKKYYPNILFVILLLVVSYYYNYHEIAFKSPQSVHKWRQSDCASIALNYYQNGMDFFHPETHNLTSDGGTSGKCCTSEIPILYYSVASFYKVFGHHDFIYRIFNTLLFFLGLYFLFRLLNYVLKDVFWAIALTLLFFTSPVLVYYGNNFLSNSSSLAFSIIGWYYFVRFYFESKQKWFLISMLVFLIAAAFKVTALFSVFAIAGIYGLEGLGLTKFKENGQLFRKSVGYLIPLLSIFIIVGSWIIYAHNYNLKHDCTYFSTTIFPIWDLNRTEIISVLEKIKNIWVEQYFHKSVLLFLLVCFLFIVSFFKKNKKLFLFSVIFIFAEVIVYILLQFLTFADHDYYVIDMYILPVLIVVTTFEVLKTHFNKVFRSPILKVIFAVFLFFNIYNAHQKINGRYEGWMNNFSENKDLYSITPYLRQIGISSDDTVISIPDGSHVSLYLMNQKGWTEYTDARFNKGNPRPYNQDSAGIQHSIDKGAKYLIVNGIKELYNKPYLQSYCTHLAGNYNNVLIFNLKNGSRNFNLTKQTIDQKLTCSAEILSSDMQLFRSETDRVFFQNGVTRSDEFVHNGTYSSKLNASSPYGMTVKFNDLKNGESLAIRVWRKSIDKSKGALIASSSTFKYYNNEYEILETDSAGWEQLSMEIFITPEFVNQELVIYLYNPGADPVYFDDLEIIRYQSIVRELN